MADTGKIIAIAKSLVSPEAIESSVSDWLDDHPEATTTVEDGAISYAKLDSSLQATADDVPALKSAFDDIGVEQDIKTITLSFEYGYIISNSGVITSAGGNYVLNKANVTPGKKYLVTASSNFTSLFYAFYDGSDVLVEKGTESQAGSSWSTITDKEVIAPAGASYIAIEGVYNVFDAELKEDDGYCFPDVEDLKEDVDEIQDVIGTIIEKKQKCILEDTTGYVINGSGVITSTSGNYCIAKCSVTPGEKYYITGSTNFSNPYFAYYASDNSLVSLGTLSPSGGTITNLTNSESIAPAGASYIVINWNTGGAKAECVISKGNALAGKWYGKKWACVGDSLTDENIRTSKHYFDYVADVTDIEPINMGDSGTGYKRGYDNDRAFYQRILDIDTSADVVTIFGSFNDIGAGYDLGTYTDTGTTTIAGCINTTIDNLISVMPAVVLGIVAPTPWETARPDSHTNADNYVNMLKKIAEHRSIPFLDLYRCSNLRPWDSDFREIAYSNDEGAGVHPNELGHKIIAPKFEAFLNMLLLY